MDNTDIIDNSTKNDVMCKCKSALGKLCSMKVKDSLDFKMTVTSDSGDGSGETECFSKTIKSDSDFSLIKTVGILMLIGGGISLLCSMCSFFKKK